MALEADPLEQLLEVWDTVWSGGRTALTAESRGASATSSCDFHPGNEPSLACYANGGMSIAGNGPSNSNSMNRMVPAGRSPQAPSSAHGSLGSAAASPPMGVPMPLPQAQEFSTAFNFSPIVSSNGVAGLPTVWRPPGDQGIHSNGQTHITGISAFGTSWAQQGLAPAPAPAPASSAGPSRLGAAARPTAAPAPIPVSNKPIPAARAISGSSLNRNISLDSLDSGDLPPGSMLPGAMGRPTPAPHQSVLSKIAALNPGSHAIPMTPPKVSGGLKAALAKQAQPYVDRPQAKLPATPYLGYMGGQLGRTLSTASAEGEAADSNGSHHSTLESPDLTVRGGQLSSSSMSMMQDGGAGPSGVGSEWADLGVAGKAVHPAMITEHQVQPRKTTVLSSLNPQALASSGSEGGGRSNGKDKSSHGVPLYAQMQAEQAAASASATAAVAVGSPQRNSVGSAGVLSSSGSSSVSYSASLGQPPSLTVVNLSNGTMAPPAPLLTTNANASMAGSQEAGPDGKLRGWSPDSVLNADQALQIPEEGAGALQPATGTAKVSSSPATNKGSGLLARGMMQQRAAALTLTGSTSAPPATAPFDRNSLGAGPGLPSCRLMAAARMIPHVDKAEKGGEDAYFITTAGQGCIGVADGVSGWAEEGVDPAEYSRGLMRHACQALDEADAQVESRDVIRYAQNNTYMPGSSTMCLCCLRSGSVLEVANIGDSGVRLIRNGCVIFASDAQQHMFNMPFQLSHPSIIDNPDDADDADVRHLEVQPGDIVVLASDGLYDNMFDDEIGQICADFTLRLRGERATLAQGNFQEGLTLADAEALASLIAETAHRYAKDPYQRTPWSVTSSEQGFVWSRYFAKGGGKMDDCTVVVGFVVPC